MSRKILSQEIDIKKGREIAQKISKKYNLWKYVNVCSAKKNDIIDLSQAGVHHSWEEDEKKFPHGSIIYELCFDVMDPVSALRSFDKAKIRDDGTLRELSIEDYFRYIETDPRENNPQNHFIKSKVIAKKENFEMSQILRTKYYNLDRIKIKAKNIKHSFSLESSFHHLFVASGKILISSAGQKVEISHGHSCFLPSILGTYEIKSESRGKCEVLKTFVE